MRIFSGRRILIISTEHWNNHFLSKHDLAVALCSLGNQVFFLNPPSRTDECFKEIRYPGMFILSYKPKVRGLRFLPRAFVSWLSKRDARRIENLAGGCFDIIWTFDPFRFENIRVFRGRWFIYHVADLHQSRNESRLAQTSQVILAPSNQLLLRFDPAKSLCIGHMIANEKAWQEPSISVKSDGRIQIGYVGNLLSRFLNYPLLVETVVKNPDCDFTFIGDENKLRENSFWRQLMKLNNVFLAGPILHEQLPGYLNRFDLFWCCYETEKFYFEASNSHKILEYLATGKPVISTRIAYYDDKEGILCMPMVNSQLPELVKKVTSALSSYMDSESVERRLKFVNGQTFEKVLSRVDEFLAARS